MNATALRLGLRENWAQFSLLVIVNAFVAIRMSETLPSREKSSPKS